MNAARLHGGRGREGKLRQPTPPALEQRVNLSRGQAAFGTLELTYLDMPFLTPVPASPVLESHAMAGAEAMWV